MSQFSHFNEQGRAKMVDISDKSSTVRTAVAVSSVRMIKEVFHQIQKHDIGKGDVLSVAQVAGIMAKKANVQHHSNVSSACIKRCRYLL